jgi:hypothetical protein
VSRAQRQPLTCPSCSAEHSFVCWSSLNVTLDRDRKQELLDGSLFIFTCPGCGAKTLVSYPLLYHDMEKQFMVWLIPQPPGEDTAPAHPGDIDEVGRSFSDTYRLRTVRELIDLKEKILIFDAGLDDRAIEAAKLALSKQIPEDHLPPGSRIFFSEVIREGDPAVERLAFAILRSDGSEEGFSIAASPLYEQMCQAFAFDVPSAGKFPIVDQHWLDLAMAQGDAAPTEPTPAPPPRTERRWWQFWK